jgi:hypothetical protein
MAGVSGTMNSTHVLGENVEANAGDGMFRGRHRQV